MKKDETAAKRRMTSLSRKSTKDLINIILRKDAVDRTQQKRINEFKTVIEKQETNLEAKRQMINDLSNEVKLVNDMNYGLHVTIDRLKTENKYYKIALCVIGICFITLLMLSL